jgi:hypothetical protein
MNSSAGVRHARDMLGYAIGFLLVDVSRFIDGQLALKNRRRQ